MLTSIRLSSVFVLDQDEAHDFYVNTLGLEVSDDVDLGFMRWLTVRVPGDDREILLEPPSNPRVGEETAAAIADLLTKGAAGGWIALNTDDPHGEHARLVAAGVEVTDEPSEKPYGVDFGVRDPFGNLIRIGKTHSW